MIMQKGIVAVAGGAFYLGRKTPLKPSLTPVVTSQTPQPTIIPSPKPIEVVE